VTRYASAPEDEKKIIERLVDRLDPAKTTGKALR
jgi:hypothetical protein